VPVGGGSSGLRTHPEMIFPTWTVPGSGLGGNRARGNFTRVSGGPSPTALTCRLWGFVPRSLAGLYSLAAPHLDLRLVGRRLVRRWPFLWWKPFPSAQTFFFPRNAHNVLVIAHMA